MSRNNFRSVLLASFIFTFISVGNIYSQDYMISMGGGLSIASDWGEEVNTGFNGAANALLGLSDNIYLGAKVGYNYFGLDETKMPSTVSGMEISASMSVLEAAPIIRIITNGRTESSPRLFLQGGAGLYNISANLSASYNGQSAESSGSSSEFGANIGVGVIMGKMGSSRFELVPSYSMIFTEVETTKYFAVNLGVVI